MVKRTIEHSQNNYSYDVISSSISVGQNKQQKGWYIVVTHDGDSNSDWDYDDNNDKCYTNESNNCDKIAGAI